MTTTETGASRGAIPQTLIVVGAAKGWGQWLTKHLFPQLAWKHVVLLDKAPDALSDVKDKLFDCPVGRAAVPPRDAATPPCDVITGAPLELGGAKAVACIAVPADAIESVCESIVGKLHQRASIIGISATQTYALSTIRRFSGERSVVGMHPLFDSSARSLDGQTVLLVPDARDPTSSAHAWIDDAVRAFGATTRLLSEAAHDETMTYVQTVAYESLLAFVDAVASSGHDLESLWETRTPLFEALLGLGARALAPSQHTVVSDILALTNGDRAANELEAAAKRLTEARRSGDRRKLVDRMQKTLEGFQKGQLFNAAYATAAAAVTAAQAKRSELAARFRTQDLIGIRPVSKPDTLRIGRILEVTPLSFTIREIMAGARGRSVFLEGLGALNARHVGIAGSPRDTTFSLGHVDLVVGDELEKALDDWLAFIRRDVRFLVPESVAGLGVLVALKNQPGVRDATLVSEVVRTGQRSVVVRVWIRADHDVDEMAEVLRARVHDIYRWPQGLSRSAAKVERLHYLGPAGTFSEIAARHAVASAALSDVVDLEPCISFDEVLAAVDDREMAILPISSSATGLVVRAVDALLRHRGDLTAGGVVDVAIRFDAYIRHSAHLADLRGASVYSHPQGLAQCGGFITRFELQPVPCASTTEALQIVAASERGAVALAGEEMENISGLKVAEREVDDLSGSITRFLLLGGRTTFGDLDGGSDPTLRSIWIGRSVTDVLRVIHIGAPAFDELLTSADGKCLWVTSRQLSANAPPPGLRSLGSAPWSPRTPVVRVEVDLPTD